MNSSAEKRAKRIFAEILPTIKPTKKETAEMTAKVNLLMARMKRIVPKNVELRVTGSISKGTNLKGNADIDLFILFRSGTTKEKLIADGLKYAKGLIKEKGDKYEIKYAEHPYVRVFLKGLGLRADIVPALRIENIEDLTTAVDRTPMHTAFINDNLTEKQRDDVRLLKHLLKAHLIYGAEAKTSGFSGYLCELLICQFGSLFKLLEAAGAFKSPLVIKPGEHHISNDRKTAEKFSSNFVVIDPVDPERNVGAGVSPDVMGNFVRLARSFTKKPSMEAFYPQIFKPEKAKARIQKIMRNSRLETYLITVPVPDKSEDVLWPQLRKNGEILVQYLKRFGFETYLLVPWMEKNEGCLLLLAPLQYLGTRMFKGPSVFHKAAVEGFVKGHKDALGFTFVEDSIYALDRNKYADVKAAIVGAVKENVMERNKDVSMKKAELFINQIPPRYADSAYLELSMKLRD